MTITRVVARRRVEDLESAAAFYERLTGEPATRFGFGGAELATVGPFLLFAGDDEIVDRLSPAVATVSVAGHVRWELQVTGGRRTGLALRYFDRVRRRRVRGLGSDG